MRIYRMTGCLPKWLFIGLAPALLVCCAKPRDSPTIIVGKARFELLTPSLVRMEYSSSHGDGGFHGKKIDFDLYARWIEIRRAIRDRIEVTWH